MFITFTEYPQQMKKVNRYNGVAPCGSRYGSFSLIWQLPDGKTEIVKLQEVVHLPGSFHLISHLQIMDKDIQIEQVNFNGLNLYNLLDNLIATAPEVDGRFVWGHDVHLGTESTEYTDVYGHCLLAPKMTGHASRQDTEKWISWHRRLALFGQKEVEMLPTITDPTRIHGKCHWESCIIF